MRHASTGLVTLALVLLSTVVPLMATTPPSNSSEGERKALLDELMRSVDVNFMVESVVHENFAATEDPPPISEEAGISAGDAERYRKAQQEISRRQREVVDRSLARLDRQKVAEAVIRPAFDATFSTAELRELVAFYRTRTGSKMAELGPALMIRVMAQSMDELRPIFGEVTGEMREEDEQNEPKWKRTMAEMRMIATAAEAYAVDNNAYPDANTIDSLAALLSPTYIREFPRKDGWGNEYRFVVSADRTHYRIVSAGEDGEFQWDSDSLLAAGQPRSGVRITRDGADDIIYQDGSFVQVPAEGAQSPEF
ncbi:MAG: DUF2059 domain-containing protein [Thermoanaerobaculia bacterium]